MEVNGRTRKGALFYFEGSFITNEKGMEFKSECRVAFAGNLKIMTCKYGSKNRNEWPAISLTHC
jgi:hypothetical protein